jgi:hypothetical protein
VAAWHGRQNRAVKVLVLACVLAGCGAELRGNPNLDVDAPSGGEDAPADDAAVVDAAPACKRVVYLSFEGETLTDAAASDAKQNRASWMTIASGTAPPYRAGAGDRAAQIQAIVTGVRAQLASFPIEVVTTRPSDGDYMMIVYGGQASQVGSRFGAAVQELDCDDLVRDDVAWVADGVSPTQRVVNFSIGAIGFGLGLTATLDPVGCMCGWDNNCAQVSDQPCRLSPNIQRDPNARQRCANAGATQDEITTFATGFCL